MKLIIDRATMSVIKQASGLTPIGIKRVIRKMYLTELAPEWDVCESFEEPITVDVSYHFNSNNEPAFISIGHAIQGGRLTCHSDIRVKNRKIVSYCFEKRLIEGAHRLKKKG